MPILCSKKRSSLNEYLVKVNIKSTERKKLNIKDYIEKGKGKPINASNNIDNILYK